MTCGIYKIFWDNTNVYVGKSQHIEERYKKHLYMLETNRHHNYLMLINYSRYGFPKLEILEECSREELNTREIWWINKLDSYNNGLNLTMGGEGSYTKEPGYYKNVLEYLTKTTLTHPQIAKITGVSTNIIDLISCRHCSYMWLEDKFPELWCELLHRKKDKDVYLIKDGYIKKITSRVEFQNTYNISSSHLSRLISKEINSVKGWHLCDKEGNFLYVPPIKNTFYFIKEGSIEKVTKLADFADKYKLDRSGLTKVTKCKLKSIKGWKLCNIDGELLNP